MKKIRIGNDIKVTWRVTENGETASWEGCEIAISLHDYTGSPVDATISHSDDGVVVVEFAGKDQVKTGAYTLYLKVVKADGKMYTLDTEAIFALVPKSVHQCPCDITCVDVETMEICGDIDCGIPGKSAYETWLENGNTGTESDYLRYGGKIDLGDFSGAECDGFVNNLLNAVREKSDTIYGEYTFSIKNTLADKQTLCIRKCGSKTVISIKGCLKADNLNDGRLIDDTTSTTETEVVYNFDSSAPLQDKRWYEKSAIIIDDWDSWSDYVLNDADYEPFKTNYTYSSGQIMSIARDLKDGRVIDVTSLFSKGGVLVHLTYDDLMTHNLVYRGGENEDIGNAVRYVGYGSGGGYNPNKAYLVMEGMIIENGVVSRYMRVATIVEKPMDVPPSETWQTVTTEEVKDYTL